jgi:hypothetical protein
LFSFWFFSQWPPPGLRSYGASELLVPGLIFSLELAGRVSVPKPAAESLCFPIPCVEFRRRRFRAICSPEGTALRLPVPSSEPPWWSRVAPPDRGRVCVFLCARFSARRRPSRCLLPIRTAVVILLSVCKDSSSPRYFHFVDSVFSGAKIRSSLACSSARRHGSLGSTRSAPPRAGLIEAALGLGLLSTPATEPPSPEIFPSRTQFSPTQDLLVSVLSAAPRRHCFCTKVFGFLRLFPTSV